MISDKEAEILFAVIMFVAIAVWIALLPVILKKRKLVEEPTAKMLHELRVREAIQAFMDMNAIQGDANIRDGIIHPVTQPENEKAMAGIYARMLRNEYTMAARRVGVDSVGNRSLFYKGPGYEAATEITCSDLIDIAEILERKSQ